MRIVGLARRADLRHGCGMVQRRSLLRIAARGVVAAALVLFCLFVGLFVLDSFAPPVSTLMIARTILGKSYERDYAPLRDVAPVVVASIVASEDARFCQNGGVDWGALREVVSGAGENGPKRGASTITMQTAKNLFLWPGRSTLRKGVEIGIALVLGAVWSKAHTLEVYLNIAEWGDGIFGVEAAAQHYFHKKASQLDASEAALLATALPNPIKRDAAHPRPFQRRLAAGLTARAAGSAEWLNCLAR
jgi:monofunctional biosynthetic peptidoglycan transglycosylase